MASKIGYFIKNFGYNALPGFYFRNRFNKLKIIEQSHNQDELKKRLDYYFKIFESFEIPESSVSKRNFSRKGKKTNYYLDFKEFLHYFKPSVKFAFHFGDQTHINHFPTLFKARPIHGNNSNSILFKLNKARHFKWVKDANTFSDKKDMLVWRGGAYRHVRQSFVKKFYNNPLVNVGQVNRPVEDVPWQKEFLTIKEQLKYKFIFCPEGNDVATNLKWVMSSNSLAFMPKPTKETWFMEGTLIAGVHYVEVKDDLSDLEEKVVYYSKNMQEAEYIINNANEFTKQFKNNDFEDLLCLKVLEKYANLSGQRDVLRF